MLKTLRIQNIILIDFCDVAFSKGLNILSGETGSGKSALMHALKALCGERVNQTILRRGASSGFVEASFEVEDGPLLALLQEHGIDHAAGDDLIIRREILSSGKGRSFINNQMAGQALLKKTGAFLMEISSQHEALLLASSEKQREILDIFGELSADAQAFKSLYDQELNCRRKLDLLKGSESERIRALDACFSEQQEIKEAHLKEGEDEALFSEYSLLANAEEIAEKIQSITHGLTGEKSGAIPILNRQKHLLNDLAKKDVFFHDLVKTYQSCLIELGEIAYSLEKYLAKLEADPERAEKINERLKLITRLKKKYGQTVVEIQSYAEGLKSKITFLENQEAEIEKLSDSLKELEEKTNAAAQKLSLSRQKAALNLGREASEILRQLNMPKVEFSCRVSSQKRSFHGDDLVEFFFSPNVGENQIAIKEFASGGELARISLTLQALLAGKAKTPTLVFDEIDSSIGGKTASVVAEKLKKIGRQHQVLCITHFPQVAKQADHHIQISKEEKDGRTLTFVQILNDLEKERELVRMQGDTLADARIKNPA